jgi:D-lactate dehydrogenase
VRAEALDKHPRAAPAAMFVADNFSSLAATVPPLLNTVSFFHSIMGSTVLSTVSNLLNRATGNFIPTWNPYMPRGAKPLQPAPSPSGQASTSLQRDMVRKVVYLPSCVTRMMGPAKGDPETDAVHAKILSILAKVRMSIVAVPCKAIYQCAL